jgi:mono/diheme cytochrome c family protein
VPASAPRALAVAVAASLAALAAACSKPRAEPTADAKALFASVCARCHGEEGRGGLPLFEGGPSPRDFADAEFQRTHTDEDIKRTIREGKGAGMPPFGATFTPEQLDALVGRVRSFDPRRN